MLIYIRSEEIADRKGPEIKITGKSEMRMLRPKKPRRKVAAVAGALSGILCLSLMGCKKASTTTSVATSVLIANQCGVTVAITMDGVSEFAIADGASDSVENVSQGSHLFEAKKSDTGDLVYSTTLDTLVGTSYTLTVPGPATVLITNRYGEILKIYVDDVYLGDIGDQVSQTVSRVRFGSYKYSASRKSDAKVVATTTVAVTEVKEYGWVITK
jgi:hypothetical protein